MPKALSIDWDALKALYLKGVTLPEIAEQSGVSYSALRARAHRYNWRENAAQAAAAVQQSVTTALAERGEAWLGKMADEMDRHLDVLRSKPLGELDLDDLDKITTIIERVDRVARRTHRLDEAAMNSQRPVIAVQINVDKAADVCEPVRIAGMDGELVDELKG